MLNLFDLQLELLCYLKTFQEIVSAGGRTVWGNPADVGKAVGGATFDVVLDNNGKDLDAVRFVAFIVENYCLIVPTFCVSVFVFCNFGILFGHSEN